MDRYAVIGNPINHSKSPSIHRLFAAQTGQMLTYDRMQVEPAAVAEEVSAFFALGGKGLNLTVPFNIAPLPPVTTQFVNTMVPSVPLVF